MQCWDQCHLLAVFPQGGAVRAEVGQVCLFAAQPMNEQPASQNRRLVRRWLNLKGEFLVAEFAEKSTKHHLLFLPFSASGEPTSEVSLYDSWRAGMGWSSSMWASVWDFAKSVEFRGLGSNGLSILCCVCSGCRKETLNYTHLKLLANELLNYTLGY